RADRSLDVILGMWHQAEHIAAFAQNAGNRIGRAIDVPARIERTVRGHITERDAAFAFEALDGRRVRDPVPLAVCDRHPDHLAGVVAAGERRIRTLDAEINVLADE